MAKPGKTLVMLFLYKSGKHCIEISEILPGKHNKYILTEKIGNYMRNLMSSP